MSTSEFKSLPLYKIANQMIHVSKAAIQFQMIVLNKSYQSNENKQKCPHGRRT